MILIIHGRYDICVYVQLYDRFYNYVLVVRKNEWVNRYRYSHSLDCIHRIEYRGWLQEQTKLIHEPLNLLQWEKSQLFKVYSLMLLSTEYLLCIPLKPKYANKTL